MANFLRRVFLRNRNSAVGQLAKKTYEGRYKAAELPLCTEKRVRRNAFDLNRCRVALSEIPRRPPAGMLRDGRAPRRARSQARSNVWLQNPAGRRSVLQAMQCSLRYPLPGFSRHERKCRSRPVPLRLSGSPGADRADKACSACFPRSRARLPSRAR